MKGTSSSMPEVIDIFVLAPSMADARSAKAVFETKVVARPFWMFLSNSELATRFTLARY